MWSRTQEGCDTTGAIQALSAGTDELSDSGNPPQQIITRLSLLERAARIAKEAAPYVHPRLVRVEMGGRREVTGHAWFG